jgi:hypothetical protein
MMLGFRATENKTSSVALLPVIGSISLSISFLWQSFMRLGRIGGEVAAVIHRWYYVVAVVKFIRRHRADLTRCFHGGSSQHSAARISCPRYLCGCDTAFEKKRSINHRFHCSMKFRDGRGHADNATAELTFWTSSSRVLRRHQLGKEVNSKQANPHLYYTWPDQLSLTS